MALEVQEELEQVDTYHDWQKQEGLPVLGGFHIPDLNEVELAPWARVGGSGAFINLDGTGGMYDAYVCEIPGGKSLEVQRHLYENFIYVLQGRGAATVWYDGMPKRTFEWQEGSLFAVPVNAWYQLFNGQESTPARFMGITDAPLVMSLFHNIDFVFNTPYAFRDRFAGEEDYFSGEGKRYHGGGFLVTNFIPDCRSLGLAENLSRGAGGITTAMEIAKNTIAPHISQFPVGTYKKSHFHPPGGAAHLLVLSGKGYSVCWPNKGNGFDERVRVDWKPGSLFASGGPATGGVPWFHQHFNGGNGPARYLAFTWVGHRYNLNEHLYPRGGGRTSIKEGGRQIEYEDEEPDIHRTFEEEVATSGAVCRMRTLVPSCTGVAD